MNFALSENPRVHPAPYRVQLLGDANKLPVDERPFDRFAGAGERGDLEDNFVTQLDADPRNDQIPIDSFHSDVLSSRAGVDRVALLLERLNPLQ